MLGVQRLVSATGTLEPLPSRNLHPHTTRSHLARAFPPPQFPTARLQIIRDLHFYEWQIRTQRLGEQLYPLYYPELFRKNSAAASSSFDEPVAASPSGQQLCECASPRAPWRRATRPHVRLQTPLDSTPS